MNPLLLVSVVGLVGANVFRDATQSTERLASSAVTIGALALGGFVVYNQLKK